MRDCLLLVLSHDVQERSIDINCQHWKLYLSKAIIFVSRFLVFVSLFLKTEKRRTCMSVSRDVKAQCLILILLVTHRQTGEKIFNNIAV